MTLESSWERQQKYIDFVEAYGALDEDERRRICWPSASVLWMKPCRRVWNKLMRRR